MHQNDTELSTVKRALYELRKARSRVAELEAAAREPIAIVGLGIRFPGGAVDAESFWNLLANGVDAITPIPSTRWDIDKFFDADPDAPGRMYTRHGGFVEHIDQFDAPFFGISPREAATMDPQQRLLMEVAWEALEDAGQDPLALAGSDTGVFVAISNSDYARLVFSDPNTIDVHSSTGINFSVASGRLSFFLGLCGPSLSVDTACSGSLVSVHLAAQSLRARECRMAIAGGVNLILTPELNINFSKARMMAAEGRCRTFDAGADGYVRGEGCGLVVLKRLADAQADHDRILAVIRGSAVNQDGRSSGLTVPNGPQQERVIRAALAIAGAQPVDIGYVEAHGTGTSLGDPIEAHALRDVLGHGRTSGSPLMIGSVKTNFGHLEAAAGVAGLIKVVLSLQNECLPPHLHFERINPHIDWQGLPIEIPVRGRGWQRSERPRLAGISSFGFSGTNAHLIVSEAPERAVESPAAPRRPVHVLTVSAASESALKAATARYAGQLRQFPEKVADICGSAKTGKAALPHRAAYVSNSAEELIESLTNGTALFTGQVTDRPEVAFLFTGQGAQFSGMGQQLYQIEPVFRDAIDECAALLEKHIDVPLADLLWGDTGRYENNTLYTQPALFALQWALVQLWRSWGLRPSVVLGHSVGEYAAACAAGVYSLADGLRLISARARLSGGLPKDVGAMTALLAPRAIVEAALAGRSPAVEIAAYNGPESVTISGVREQVEAMERELMARGYRVERLNVSHAFHSRLMEPVADVFASEAASLHMATPETDYISTVTGGLATTELTQPLYWRRQLRNAVLFEQAMAALAAHNCKAFVEIGPGSTLVGLGEPLIGRPGQVWLPSIRRSREDAAQTGETLAALWTAGVPFQWKNYEAGRGQQRVPVPAYPFERQRYWVPIVPAASKTRTPLWNAIEEAGSRQSRQGRLDLDIGSYPKRWDFLDRLTTAFILSTFAAFGVFRTAGETYSVDTLLTACAIDGGYRRLVQRWLRRLESAGYLREEGETFESAQPLPLPDLDGLRRESTEVFGADRSILEYVLSCGDQLVSILTGRVSPLETLFPGGSFTRAESIYEHAPLSAYFGALARSILQAIVRARGESPLRLIEIGAGTGSTTAPILPEVPAGSSYYFTDISELFLHHGRSKFAGHSQMRYGIYNVETGESSDVPLDGGFDVAVATNAIHAVRDLDAALRNVRSLLVPGGCFILCEVTEHLSWFDITTGLIEGWQLFEDKWRTDQPLLPPGKWTEALAAAGFAKTIAWPDSSSPAGVLGQHVIVSMAPGQWNAAPVGYANDEHQELGGGHTPAHADAASAASRDLLATLNAALPETRHDMLVEVVRREMAAVLRTKADGLDPNRRLTELGMDSLMALEFRSRLSKALPVAEPLPATLVFDHPTIDRLAKHLAANALGLNGTKHVDTDPVVAPQRAVEIEAMSDEQAEEVLMQKILSLRGPS